MIKFVPLYGGDDSVLRIDTETRRVSGQTWDVKGRWFWKCDVEENQIGWLQSSKVIVLASSEEAERALLDALTAHCLRLEADLQTIRQAIADYTSQNGPAHE